MSKSYRLGIFMVCSVESIVDFLLSLIRNGIIIVA